MDVPSVLVGVALGAAVAGAVSCFAAPHCHGEQKPTADSAWNGNMDNVDEMKVTLSSLNRHAVATMPDVGIPKVEIMKRYFNRLMPWCEVEAVPQMFKGEYADDLLKGGPTYVLDCIDDVTTKAELIAYCHKRAIPVITSTGAGAKADPTKLRISKLSDCVKDPLASKIKWKLKQHGVNPEEITTVFSVEKPTVNLMPLSEEQKQSPQEFGAVDYFRLRIMPVLGTSPAIFGQSMAAYVTCILAGHPIEPDSCDRMSKNVRHKMLQNLRTAETKRFGTAEHINIDDEELEFLIQQVWQNRCASTGRRIGGHAIMVLARWRAELPPTVSNLVLLTQPEAARLEQYGCTAFSDDIVRFVSRRLAWAASVYEGDSIFGVDRNQIRTTSDTRSFSRQAALLSTERCLEYAVLGCSLAALAVLSLRAVNRLY